MEPIDTRKRKLYNYSMYIPKHKSYTYYDTPDGQDLGKKMYYLLKKSSQIGYAVGGFLAIHHWNPPAPRYWMIFETFRLGTPLVLSSMVYALTTYSLTQIRGKDDTHNAQLGGLAAGLVYGTWFRSPTLAIAGACIGAIGCELKKRAVLAGDPFPSRTLVHEAESSWALRNLDFTLTEDIPGNWTSVPRVPRDRTPPPPPPPPPPPEPSICEDF